MITDALNTFLQELADQALDTVRKDWPYQTGQSYESWSVRIEGNQLVLYNDSGYAQYIKQGTVLEDAMLGLESTFDKLLEQHADRFLEAVLQEIS